MIKCKYSVDMWSIYLLINNCLCVSMERRIHISVYIFTSAKEVMFSSPFVCQQD